MSLIQTARVTSAEPVIVMEDTTASSGWGIYSTRPVLSEYVSATSVLVGKQIDSITVSLKKSSSTATGTAYVGIINTDLSVKKLFATISISSLTSTFTIYEYALPAGDSYTVQAGDRIGVKNTGGSSSGGNYLSIMRDTSSSGPFDGANTYLSYYTTSWTAKTTHDLTMTLKYSGTGGSSNIPPVSDAGPDQPVNEGTLVTLTGLASSDPDGNTPLTYSWSQTSGPAVSLSSATAAQPTFTAPSVSVATVLTFSLVVTDSLLLADPSPDTVQVTVNDVPPYYYDPAFADDGTDYQEIPGSGSLQLTIFSVATWFKTFSQFSTDAYIVNKGGSGSETAGNNMNYGIWITSSEKIQAGFETNGGTDHFVTATPSYNDNTWHYAVVTYDGTSTVRLYIDGVQIGTKSTSGALPDTAGSSHPLRVGANSLSLNKFFIGSIDEVRVWNRVLSSAEVADQHNVGVFDASGQVVHLPFGVPPANVPPVSNAGIDQSVGNNALVTLTGLASTDPDNSLPLTYSWAQIGGPTVTLTGANTAQPTFTAPSVSAATVLTFSLVVTDNLGLADPTADTMMVTVSGTPPAPDGVLQIYPSEPGAEQWFMNMDNADNDIRFNPQDPITQNPDGSWKMQDSQVRMHVYTSSGHHTERITTYVQTELAVKGYMQDPASGQTSEQNNWKNVEMTGYVKVNAVSQNDNFEWNARGSKHTNDNGGCGGTAYKGDLYWSGLGRFAKEQQHSDGYSFTPTISYTTSIMGSWVGFKFMLYSVVISQGGSDILAAKMENWIDMNNDGNWIKVDEKLDAGGWGDEGILCGGTPDQIITWGGPVATFRWDNASDVDFKFLSVREIIPPSG